MNLNKTSVEEEDQEEGLNKDVIGFEPPTTPFVNSETLWDKEEEGGVVDFAIPSSPYSAPTNKVEFDAPDNSVRLPGDTLVKTENRESGSINLEKTLEKYSDSLVKEDFLEDEDLQELVYQSLEARKRDDPNLIQLSRGKLTSLAGGVNVSNYNASIRDLPFEEVFEWWQNYQRSLSSAHSVTVANEMTFVMGADDDAKNKLGAGYALFDRMDNAFTGEGSWGEMFDAIRDYGKSAVLDPINLATLGIGKGIAAAGTKAGFTALKTVMKKASLEAAKKGIAQRAGVGLVGAAIKSAPFMAPDLAFNVGIDAIEQNVRIKTGARDEFSWTQSAAVAAGTILIPTVVGAVSAAGALRKNKVFKGTAFDVPDLTQEKAFSLTGPEAWAILHKNIDQKKVSKAIESSFGGTTDEFGKLSGNTKGWKDWIQVRKEANGTVGDPLTQADAYHMFEERFWLGDPKTKTKGFYEALEEAGFRVTPGMLQGFKGEGGTTAVFAQAVEKFLPDESAKKILKKFEKEAGVKLGIEYDAKNLAAMFAKTSNVAGKALGLRATLSRMTRFGLDEETATRILSGSDEPLPEKKVQEFGLSVYKRLLTSTYSTTGANIVGFGQLVSFSTLGDVFSTGVYATQKGFYDFVKGDADKAVEYANKMFGTGRALPRRLASALSPDIDFKYSMDLIDSLPEEIGNKVRSKLFRDISGDGGIRDALEMYGLEGDTWAKRVDSVTKTIQKAAMVPTQDETTKLWAFGGNFDRALEKEFGVSAQDFMNNPENGLLLTGKRFTKVWEEAVFKTNRETASVNWSTLPFKKGWRGAARELETFTNKRMSGFIVPFGSFMNTMIATTGDLTAVNAIRHVQKVATGKTLDYADGDFGEVMGKGLAGISIIAYGVPEAYDKIRAGFSYNEDIKDTGRVADDTFVWPGSSFGMLSTIMAHAIIPQGDKSVSDMIADGSLEADWDNIPTDLKTEFVLSIGGQAVRDIDDFAKTALNTLTELRDDPSFQNTFKALLAGVSRPVQGALRPLDPINDAAALIKGHVWSKDLRQGAREINQMLKYVNNIFPLEDDLPRRADPLRGLRKKDPGKQIFGARSKPAPNLTERIFNSAGLESWRKVRWSGPPEVRNMMDSIAAPIFDSESKIIMDKNPDYFSMARGGKERVVELLMERVRKRVLKTIEEGTPRSLNMVRLLSNDKKKTRLVMDKLGYEGLKPEDLLEEEDGLESLARIKYFVDNYDRLEYQHIK